MTPAEVIILQAAASHRALKRTAAGYKPVRPWDHRVCQGVTVAVRAATVSRMCADGLLAFVNETRSAAVITDAGRAAIGGKE
jgi:hypothetical protein